MIIVLDWRVAYRAAMVGVCRNLASLQKGLNDNERCDKNTNWQNDIESAGAECAAAQALNRYWPGGVNTFEAPDIPPDIQVRSSIEEGYSLLVRKKDKDEERFVLVIGKMPTFDIVGWLYGHEAKMERWLRNPDNKGPAYFVPQGYLNPMENFEQWPEITTTS